MWRHWCGRGKLWIRSHVRWSVLEGAARRPPTAPWRVALQAQHTTLLPNITASQSRQESKQLTGKCFLGTVAARAGNKMSKIGGRELTHASGPGENKESQRVRVTLLDGASFWLELSVSTECLYNICTVCGWVGAWLVYYAPGQCLSKSPYDGYRLP